MDAAAAGCSTDSSPAALCCPVAGLATNALPPLAIATSGPCTCGVLCVKGSKVHSRHLTLGNSCCSARHQHPGTGSRACCTALISCYALHNRHLLLMPTYLDHTELINVLQLTHTPDLVPILQYTHTRLLQAQHDMERCTHTVIINGRLTALNAAHRAEVNVCNAGHLQLGLDLQNSQCGQLPLPASWAGGKAAVGQPYYSPDHKIGPMCTCRALGSLPSCTARSLQQWTVVDWQW